MNTRFFVLVGSVFGLSLSACVVTSDTSGDGGSGGAATTTTTTATGGAGGGTTTTTTTTNVGGGGGAGGAATCGNCNDMLDPTSTTPEVCANDQAAIDAYDALFSTCACDATAGCGADCGSNLCDNKDVDQACLDCIVDQTGPCSTELTACSHN
jgi:hypothetical protein